MSTVKLILNKQRAKDPTLIPVYARITKDRRSSYIALGITVSEEYWDEGSQRVNILHPNRIRMNATLGKISNDIERVILEDIDSGKNSTSQQLKDQYLGKCFSTFTDYARRRRDQYLENQKYGRYKQLKGILSKLDEYTRNRTLQFRDITYEFIVDYEKWLRSVKRNRQNTIHTDLKFIRQLFRDAIRDGLIDTDQNPFIRYKIATERTTREYLSESELYNLESLEIESSDSAFDCYNMFILACYTGLRISDLLTLRSRNFDGEHLNIRMRKTKESLSILVPTKGKDIVQAYTEGKDDSEFVFPFLSSTIEYSEIDLQKQIMSKTALCNKYLKYLAEKARICTNLSFHVSRHTFATRALRMGIRIEYVSKLLGHADFKTTQIYAKIVNKELDHAMAVFG